LFLSSFITTLNKLPRTTGATYICVLTTLVYSKIFESGMIFVEL